MNCKKCGAIVTNEDQFCKICGAAVEKVATSNVVRKDAVVSPLQNTGANLSTQNAGIIPTTEILNENVNKTTDLNNVKSSNDNTIGVQQSSPAAQAFGQSTVRSNDQYQSNMQQPNPAAQAFGQSTVRSNDQYQSNMQQPSPAAQAFGQSTVRSNDQYQSNMQQSSPTAQSWTNGYGAQPVNHMQPKQSNNNLKYIIIGVIAVVVIFAGIFVVSNLFKDKSNAIGGSQTVSKNTYDVNFKGFKFKIPDNLVYEESDGVLLIGNEENTWAAQIELESGSYAQIKNNMSQLQSKFQSLGYTASAAVEKTVNGTNFITMEMTMSGTKAVLAIAKANSMYFMGITAVNQDNDFDYSILNTIAPIVNSVTYVGKTNNMKTNINLDFKTITDLAQ